MWTFSRSTLIIFLFLWNQITFQHKCSCKNVKLSCHFFHQTIHCEPCCFFHGWQQSASVGKIVSRTSTSVPFHEDALMRFLFFSSGSLINAALKRDKVSFRTSVLSCRVQRSFFLQLLCNIFISNTAKVVWKGFQQCEVIMTHTKMLLRFLWIFTQFASLCERM